MEGISRRAAERCSWNAMERQGLRFLVSLGQGESGAWRSRRRLPEGKMQLAGSEDGGWPYTKQERGVQNGNSG